ncbi:MAG: PGN_0703 family putative restriction endonuclease [Polyangiaceae bacterium]
MRLKYGAPSMSSSGSKANDSTKRRASVDRPYAESTLSNFLTDNIKRVVRREVLDASRAKDKLFGRPRIFNDLLSSQPLCFNVFAELSLDLDLASRALARLTSGRVSDVTSIDFEHSPGKGDARYTGDRSAFDVFVRYRAPGGKRGFAGIEVKYHEALGDRPSSHKPRYDEVARTMACFDTATSSRLRDKPLQQIWRDHLLAGSLLAAADFDEGFFAFLYPAENERCAKALEGYRACLTNAETFETWTLESLMSAVLEESQADWAKAVVDRYLDFGKLDSFEP